MFVFLWLTWKVHWTHSSGTVHKSPNPTRQTGKKRGSCLCLSCKIATDVSTQSGQPGSVHPKLFLTHISPFFLVAFLFFPLTVRLSYGYMSHEKLRRPPKAFLFSKTSSVAPMAKEQLQFNVTLCYFHDWKIKMIRRLQLARNSTERNIIPFLLVLV